MSEIQKTELRELLKETLQEVLGSTSVKEEFLSRNQLCERLGISLPTLDKWSAEGTIKGKLIIGGRIRYKWSEVEQSLNSNAA